MMERLFDWTENLFAAVGASGGQSSTSGVELALLGRAHMRMGKFEYRNAELY